MCVERFTSSSSGCSQRMVGVRLAEALNLAGGRKLEAAAGLESGTTTIFSARDGVWT